MLFSLLHVLYVFIIFESDPLVVLTVDLCDDDSDEAAQSHTNEVGKSSGEDANDDGNEDCEKCATKEHLEAVVTMVTVTVVAHVMRSVVRVVLRLARLEPVRRFAVSCCFRHRVGATVSMGPLVATFARFPHALDAVPNDVLPLAP